MLIIGHRGSCGTHPENSIAALREGIASGADMIEFDVRLTSDGKLVLAHDFHLYRSHKQLNVIRNLSLSELRKRTAGSESPIVTLDQALKACAGKLFLNIEVKDRGSGIATLEVLTRQYKDHIDDVMITSFSVRELRHIRNLNQKIKLGLLMRLNPFAFLAHERTLHLSAVGFHRLHLNPLATKAAHQLDIFVYVYTVNRLSALEHLESQQVDGVVTDYPRKFAQKV